MLSNTNDSMTEDPRERQDLLLYTYLDSKPSWQLPWSNALKIHYLDTRRDNDSIVKLHGDISDDGFQLWYIYIYIFRWDYNHN